MKATLQSGMQGKQLYVYGGERDGDHKHGAVEAQSADEAEVLAELCQLDMKQQLWCMLPLSGKAS